MKWQNPETWSDKVRAEWEAFQRQLKDDPIFESHVTALLGEGVKGFEKPNSTFMAHVFSVYIKAFRSGQMEMLGRFRDEEGNTIQTGPDRPVGQPGQD